jgi:hypothetical protein
VAAIAANITALPPENKNPASYGGVQSGGESLTKLALDTRSGGNPHFFLVRLAQHVAAAPDHFTSILPFMAGCRPQM